MANNFDSNITRKLARVFLDKFESKRTISKSVNTQLLSGAFNPSSGTVVDFKRPHDYRSLRTAGGDISNQTKNDIISGKASGVVQDFFTVPLEWANVDEALKMDQLDQILAPAADRIVTDLEVDFARFMVKNCNLSYGTPGTAIDAWSDVAGAGALMRSLGIPMDDAYYAMNPFSTMLLADKQAGLASGDNALVNDAWRKSKIARDFGGLQAFTATTLSSYTSGTASDRAGTLASPPNATYVTHKDTMIQELAVTALSTTGTVKAGEIVEVTGRHRINLSTKEPILDHTGARVKWRGVVTEDVTLAGGAGTLKVAGPAIREANGQYNTVDSALDTGDVITILGTASTIYQPSLFYHKNAFAIGTVKLPKLYATDTVATTADGISIRVTRYSDGDANKQMVRFDLLPAYAALNPFFAGQAFGV